MMQEPENLVMGYTANGYGAECSVCNERVEIELDQYPLTASAKLDMRISERRQEAAYALLFYYTIEKFERDVGCGHI